MKFNMESLSKTLLDYWSKGPDWFFLWYRSHYTEVTEEKINLITKIFDALWNECLT